MIKQGFRDLLRDMDDPHGCGKCRNLYGANAAVVFKPPGMDSRRVSEKIPESMLEVNV
jgi:hypothetical protein